MILMLFNLIKYINLRVDLLIRTVAVESVLLVLIFPAGHRAGGKINEEDKIKRVPGTVGLPVLVTLLPPPQD